MDTQTPKAWILCLIERTNPEWRDLFEDFLLPPGALPFDQQLRDAPQGD
jgi:hypothetical protein